MGVSERRYAEVDYIKAVGILPVPLIHTLRADWDLGISDAEVVFLIAMLIALMPLLARLPVKWIAALAVVMFLLRTGQIVATAIAGDLEWIIFTNRWLLRSPILWWTYFLLGCLVRLHYPTVSSWVEEHRTALLARDS